MKAWKQEICATQPEMLQEIGPGLYMERRNVTQVEHPEQDGRPAYVDYQCESREITVSEYEMLKSIEAISTDKAIDDFTAQLIEEGVI